MTEKEILRKAVTRITMPAHVMAAIAVVSIIAMQMGHHPPSLWFLVLTNILLIAIISELLLLAFLVRCPGCRTGIGIMFLLTQIKPTNKWINRDWGLNHCPECGRDFTKGHEEGSNKASEATSGSAPGAPPEAPQG